MTPAVEFSEETGRMELKGRSIPENSIEFFFHAVHLRLEFLHGFLHRNVLFLVLLLALMLLVRSFRGPRCEAGR